MTLTYVPRRLAQAAPTTTDETTAYTVPGGQLCIVKQIMVANTVPGSVDVTVSIVPTAGSPTVGTRLLNAITVPGKSVLVFDLSQVMETGDFISVKVSSPNTATFTISGVETTVAALPAAGLHVFKDDVPIGLRPKLNLHEGAFIDILVADDASAGEVDLTIIGTPQAYAHSQGVAADTWLITHNLGFYPSAVVIDSGGSVVEGDITYPSINQMQIAFAAAISGVAYLS